MDAMWCIDETFPPAKPRLRHSIGELAEAASTSARTIRYYEELGVLPLPERSPAGTRRYSADYVSYLDGIRILKELGFGLGEIAAVAAEVAPEVRTRRARALIARRIAELSDQHRFLSKLDDAISGSARIPDPRSLLGIVGRELRG